MGSDENCFNALTLMKAFHKTVSVNHNLWREGKAEAESNRSPSAYQPNALPLGQAGSYTCELPTLTGARCTPWAYRNTNLAAQLAES